MPSPAQRAVSEALGTAFLLATVIGSGIMAQRLSGGNDALALLCNTLPTGAILTVLILILGPVSGAHFNPAGASSLRCAANCPGQWQAAISLPSCVAPLSAFGWRILCLNCRRGSSRRMSGQARGNGSPRRSRPSDFVDHSRLPGTCARRHCLRRRSLHYGRILVHGVDVVRQSGGHHRAGALRHVRGDRPHKRSCIHLCAACGRTRRAVTGALALDRCRQTSFAKSSLRERTGLPCQIVPPISISIDSQSQRAHKQLR